MHLDHRLKGSKANFTRVAASIGLLSLTLILAGCSAKSGPSTPSGGNGNSAPITVLTAFTTIGSSTNFSTPAGILYTNGNLWVADSTNNNLSEWTTTGTNLQTITTFNGGATFDNPWGVNLGPSNDIYVADYSNSNVELFNSSGGYITSVNSSVLSGTDPAGVAVNSGGTTLLVLSAAGMGVFGFPINSGSTPTYGTPATLCTGGPVTTTSFPLGLKLDKSGNIWVADKGGHYLVEFNSSGAFQKAVSFGTNPFSPQDLAFDNSGNMYVADSGGHQLVVFNASGSPVTAITNLNLSTPAGIATDGNGTFYITDYGHKQIVVCH